MVVGSTIAINASPPHFREIDAARALLGVTPQSTRRNESANTSVSNATFTVTNKHTLLTFPKRGVQNSSCQPKSPGVLEVSTSTPHGFSSGSEENDFFDLSRSSGLDTLAALAIREQNASTHRPLPSFLLPAGGSTRLSSSSQSNQIDSSTPTPARSQVGRLRSVSNPEGMEKWDSLLSSHHRSNRRHFVLPASILEEELAEANEAVRRSCKSLIQKSCIPEDAEFLGALELPDSNQSRNFGEDDNASPELDSTPESKLTQDELLRRARSRLLEDLSSEVVIMNGEKGVVTLPHSLTKYKEIYNKNGRIGIYTPSERAAIIARFNDKRTRRNWNKKIRYNCRKNLADRRLRVKGRFVKRSEQEELAKKLKGDGQEEIYIAVSSNSRIEKRVTISDKIEISEDDPLSDDESQEDDAPWESRVRSRDEDMPDVSDPDAGFSPTEDQPFRRLRRHTIT